MTSMILRVNSKKKLDEVARELEAAAQRHKFGVLGVHDLKARMNEKGVEFSRDCLIFEVCNPQQAKKVLEANAAIATALPCRIAVYPEGNGVTLATLQPTALLGMFDVPDLAAVAQEVEQTILRIMEDAAR
jgi:uncharacterized protein (DUF302 family)